MASIVRSRRAQAEIEEATATLGLRFDDELARNLDLLAANPRIGPPHRSKRYPGLRKRILPDCQHYVYYLYLPPPEDVVILVSVYSNRRKPPRL